jgi:hypothetical protein
MGWAARGNALGKPQRGEINKVSVPSFNNFYYILTRHKNPNYDHVEYKTEYLWAINWNEPVQTD